MTLMISGAFAGVASDGAAPEPTGRATVGASGASSASTAVAALVEDRGARLSRSSSRMLLIEKQKLRTARAERAEARAKVRAEARAEQAQRQRERAQRAADRAQRAAELEARAWRTPLTGYRVTATFGQSSSLWSTVHTGVDLAAPAGVPVTSIARGIVTSAGYDGAYGNKVVVQHEDGTETWYAHLASISVTVGRSVTHHTVVGLVGSTGNVTGPHLHLEARPAGGDPIDPLTALAARGVQL